MRLFIFLLFLTFITLPLYACESCTIAYMGKKDKRTDENKHIISAKVLYEEQDWEEIPAGQAHQLHHQGHHMHDKQNEQVIHAILTAHVTDRFSMEADIPYVRRHFIEIDSHAHLGENQTSEGLSDIVISSDYRFLQDQSKSLGVILGVKTPTGKTDNETTFGSLIEPELQPGTGSADYLAGLTGAWYPGDLDLSASAIYIYKTEGKQDFRYGDVFSLSLHADKKFVVNNELRLKTGLILNNQLEKKQNNEDGVVKDSGGYTMLLGPQAELSYKDIAIGASYLFPAVQNLGGVHQELDKGIWTSSIEVRF
jgi:hypothetical protein